MRVLLKNEKTHLPTAEVGSICRPGNAHLNYSMKSSHARINPVNILLWHYMPLGESVDCYANHHQFEIIWGEDDLGIDDPNVFVLAFEQWMVRPILGPATSLESRYGRFLAYDKYRRILLKAMETMIEELPGVSCPMLEMYSKVKVEPKVVEANKVQKRSHRGKRGSGGKKGRR